MPDLLERKCSVRIVQHLTDAKGSQGDEVL